MHYEIDCRKCENCDMQNDRCAIYGNDPEKAVKACAANQFKHYTETAVTYDCDGYDPHTVAEAMCWKCGKRWIATFPSATLLKQLECPGCGEVGHAFLTGQDILQGD